MAERSFREGLRRYENKDLLGAVQLWRDAVRMNPTKGEYHLHLGMALSRNPRWVKEAEQHLLEASRKDPFNVQIFLTLGKLYTDAGLKKRAESQYRAALMKDPLNREAQRALDSLTGGASKDEDDDGGGGGKGGFFSKLFKKK
jgi:tetratricopeptide (TPR) repeat protein